MKNLNKKKKCNLQQDKWYRMEMIAFTDGFFCLVEIRLTVRED